MSLVFRCNILCPQRLEQELYHFLIKIFIFNCFWQYRQPKKSPVRPPNFSHPKVVTAVILGLYYVMQCFSYWLTGWIPWFWPCFMGTVLWSKLLFHLFYILYIHFFLFCTKVKHCNFAMFRFIYILANLTQCI